MQEKKIYYQGNKKKIKEHKPLRCSGKGGEPETLVGYISIFTPPSSPQCLGCTLRFLSRLWCRVVQIHWTRPPYDTGQRPNARSRLPAASPRGDHLRRLPGSKSEGQVSIQQKSPCALARLQRFFGTGGCGSTGKKKKKDRSVRQSRQSPWPAAGLGCGFGW